MVNLKILALASIGFGIMSAKAELLADQQKNLRFNAEIKTEQSGQTDNLLFTPPLNHHFNLEAPSQVKIEAETLNLQKTLQSIEALSKKKLTDCKVKAELYLCNNENTYCVPVKEEFSCNKLKRTVANTTVSAHQTASAKETTDAHETKNAKESKGENDISPAYSGKPIKPNDPIKTQYAPESNLFILNDEASAFAQALKEDKPVLIDFFGIWCPPCNMLDETIFKSTAFIKLKKEYVYLKLDADKPVSFELKSKFNIKGYPTVVIANKNKDLITTIGNLNLEPFIAQMQASLKFKNLSIEKRIEIALKSNQPELAIELATMYLNLEDITKAHYFSQIALDKAPLSAKQKMQFNKIQLAVLKDFTKDENSLKKLSQYYLNLITKNKPGIENFELASDLIKLSEDLKDETLKKQANTVQKESIEYLLKNKSLLKEIDYVEGDLLAALAAQFEDSKNEALAKEYYAIAAMSYENQIKKIGLSLDTERGNNLERAYCLNKAGQTEKALAIYQNLEQIYPEEFTFYNAHAIALKENGKIELALEKANLALKYSYGDNLLRATHLVASLQNQLGKKTEALTLIKKTLNEFPDFSNLKVRSKRYLDKLKSLTTEIEKK